MLGPRGFGMLNRFCMSCWTLSDGVPSVEPAEAGSADAGNRQVELQGVAVRTQKEPESGEAVHMAPVTGPRVPAWLRRAGLDTKVKFSPTAAPIPVAVISVKCGLHEEASDVATEMMRELVGYRGLGEYRFCFPNAFGGSCCDRSVGEDHCLGLCETKCCLGEGCDEGCRSFAKLCGELSDEPISDHSCWAYAFRTQQRHARRCPRGVMVQVVEVEDGTYVMDDGQQIEAEMARLEQLKTFRLHVRSPDQVRPHAENLARQVQAWQQRGCPDDGLELLWHLDTGYGCERQFARALVPGDWPSLASSHSPLDYRSSAGYSTYDLAPETPVRIEPLDEALLEPVADRGHGVGNLDDVEQHLDPDDCRDAAAPSSASPVPGS